MGSFDKLLSSRLEDPGFRAGFEDSRARRELIDELVRLRSELGIKQKRLAEQMGVTQSTVSQFEYGTDARISTLQRYARAIGYTITFELDASSPRTSAVWSDEAISQVAKGSSGKTVAPRDVWTNLHATVAFTHGAHTAHRWVAAA